MTVDKDLQTIAAVLQGEREAFGDLIDRYQQQVFRLSMGILRDPDRAEEATHVTFIKAYENLGRFRKGARFSSWLYRIAYNTCITDIRQVKKKETIEYNMEVRPHEPSINEGFADLTRADQRTYIEDALAALSDDEAFLIKGYYLEELDISELVTITGLSQSNVKVKLHRARKRIYTHLKEKLASEAPALIGTH